MKIEVKTDKSYYVPMQTVEGNICVFCEESTMIKALKLRIYKRIKVGLKKINEGAPEQIVDDEMIINDQYTIICENTILMAGINTFPFSFKISCCATGTGIAKSYFTNSMTILEKSLLMQAISETMPSGQKSLFPFQVQDTNIVTSREKHISIVKFQESNTTIDTVIKMSSFMCLLAQKMSFRIQTDKHWYSRGDTITFSLYPINRIERPMVANISANFYQVVHVKENVQSKLVTSFKVAPVNKNNFSLQFRIPMAISPCISDKEFSVKCFMIFNLNLFNGKQLKIRKPLNIGEVFFEVPDPEENLNAEKFVYVTKFLEYQEIKQ